MLTLFLFSMLLGSLAGVLAGLFGLGGGVVIVPSLAWLFFMADFPAPLVMIMSVATSLATIIITAVSSVLSHHKLRNIIWAKVYALSPGILIGAGCGALLADQFEGDTLKWVFITYLFYVGFKMAMPAKKRSMGGLSNKLDLIMSLIIGLCSSLLGIGGGTLTVPYLVASRQEMKNAVAIASACGLPIAISGTIVYMYLGWNVADLPEWSFGYVYLPAFAGITLTSMFTAPLGARLASQLPAKKLKRYFSVVIILIAIKMMVR